MTAGILEKIFDLLLRNKLVGILMFLAVLGGVSLFAVRSLTAMDINQLISIGLLRFLPPFGLILLAYLNRLFFWTRVTRSFGLKAPFFLAGKAFFYSILGRYVPGKAGLFLLRLRAYGGRSKKKVGAAMVTEYIATILAASLLVLMGSLLAAPADSVLLRWIPIGLAIAALIALHPGILRRIVNALIKLTGRRQLAEFPTAGAAASLTFGYMITGLIHGMALYIILNMFDQLPFALYPAVTGSYYMAGLIGIFAFFAPGGLGVREGILFLMLSSYIDTGAVVLGATLMRLLTLIAELFLAGCFSLAAKWAGYNDSEQEGC